MNLISFNHIVLAGRLDAVPGAAARANVARGYEARHARRAAARHQCHRPQPGIDERSRRHVHEPWLRRRADLHPSRDGVVFRAPARRAAHARRARDAAHRCGDRPERPGRAARSAAELAAVSRGNPFLRKGAETKGLHVLFLRDAPPARRIDELDPLRSPPDAFAVRERGSTCRAPTAWAARSSRTTTSIAGSTRSAPAATGTRCSSCAN